MDPTGAEKLFSKIEDTVAPILKRLDEELRGPREDELDHLLLFMAIQWIRVPAFRPTILAIADSFHRSKISEALQSPESWTRMLIEAGISPDDPAADYERAREFQRSGEYSLSAETEWYLMRGLQGVETIIARLKDRHWGVCISRRGSFIASDNPVAMDGPRDCKIGFKTAEIITYPVSRHVLLYGTNIPVRTPLVSQMFIAHKNTFAMLTADEQVYSTVSDFCWLDLEKAYKTDWRQFSKRHYE
jgi:Protein of unknown function (DUF4238)